MSTYYDLSLAAKRPRSQIFVSGLAAKQTYVVDGDTYQTWALVTVKHKQTDGTEIEISRWQPFEY